MQSGVASTSWKDGLSFVCSVHILHDWDLPTKKMLIRKGFDYTGRDCAGWMLEAGFAATRVEHLVGPDSMVIGIK